MFLRLMMFLRYLDNHCLLLRNMLTHFLGIIMFSQKVSYWTTGWTLSNAGVASIRRSPAPFWFQNPNYMFRWAPLYLVGICQPPSKAQLPYPPERWSSLLHRIASLLSPFKMLLPGESLAIQQNWLPFYCEAVQAQPEQTFSDWADHSACHFPPILP